MAIQDLIAAIQGHSGTVYDPTSYVSQTPGVGANGMSSLNTVQYDPQRVRDAILEARAQGFSDMDIAQGAGRYGATQSQIADAFAALNPDQYYSPGQVHQMFNDASGQGLQAVAALGNDPMLQRTNATTGNVTAGYQDMGWQPRQAQTPVAQQTQAGFPQFNLGGQPQQRPVGQSNAGQSNPYLQDMARNITDQTNSMVQRQLGGINSAAVAAGGIGGSRQGLAQGTAIGDAARGLSGSLANLYGGQYNMDRSHQLASDTLALNEYNANQNWMRTGQQDQLNLYDRMLGWNQQGLANASNAYNQPLNYYSQFANIGGNLAGMGGSQNQTLQGNPYLGMMGGWLASNGMWPKG